MDADADHFKELVNKIAWAIGSTYGVPYDDPRQSPRLEAIEIALGVIHQLTHRPPTGNSSGKGNGPRTVE